MLWHSPYLWRKEQDSIRRLWQPQAACRRTAHKRAVRKTLSCTSSGQSRVAGKLVIHWHTHIRSIEVVPSEERRRCVSRSCSCWDLNECSALNAELCWLDLAGAYLYAIQGLAYILLGDIFYWMWLTMRFPTGKKVTIWSKTSLYRVRAYSQVIAVHFRLHTTSTSWDRVIMHS